MKIYYSTAKYDSVFYTAYYSDPHRDADRFIVSTFDLSELVSFFCPVWYNIDNIQSVSMWTPEQGKSDITDSVKDNIITIRDDDELSFMFSEILNKTCDHLKWRIVEDVDVKTPLMSR